MSSIQQGTYDVILNRLATQNELLLNGIQQLNEQRKNVFGATAFQLLNNIRIATENYCLARDLVSVGNFCILGYNVQFGLKQQISIQDVFSIYNFHENSFELTDYALLNSADFINEFESLYKYYRHASFSRFHVQENWLYMVFQQSENPFDIKAFKWLMLEDALQFVDARSAHEIVFPNPYDFEWKRATRDMQRVGKSPHLSILDRAFVETINGDLTIKIEDNTNTGKGIYSEEVSHKDQTLDDAEIYFAPLGNIILLKIKPYQEDFRYFIFNDRLKTVVKADTLKDSGILLPENQGILLSNGFYLQSGDYKILDRNIENLKFLRKIDAPNGEDFLYVYYHQKQHEYVLLSYNIIEQQIQTPIFCKGYTIFPNGLLAYFLGENEATKHHLLQLWQTPYATEPIINPAKESHYLYKVGNRDIVRAMAELKELHVLLNQKDNYEGLYDDIMAKSRMIGDSYFWVNDETHFSFKSILKEINQIASSAIDEFERVLQYRKQATERLEQLNEEKERLFFEAKSTTYERLEQYVQLLTALRMLRGQIVSAKSENFMDVAALENMDAEVQEKLTDFSEKTVAFLLQDNALQAYEEQIEIAKNKVGTLTKTIDAKALEDEVTEIAKGLEMLIEIVNQLHIEDATLSSKVVENISALFSQINRIKTAIKNTANNIGATEKKVAFQAQISLFDQAVINMLDRADELEKVAPFLTRLMVQLEEIDMRFADWPEASTVIEQKRAEMQNLFESRRLQLTDQRNNKINRIFSSAERILQGVRNRIDTFKDEVEIHAFFSTDLMVERARKFAEELMELKDTAKAEEIAQALLVLEEEAVRNLKDRQDLYKDGNTILSMGKHKFATQKQQPELTLILKDNQFWFHIIGTSFYEAVQDARLAPFQSVYHQELLSQNETVRRAEVLAWKVFEAIREEDRLLVVSENFEQRIANYIQAHPEEAYIKGVHDKDALELLHQLWRLYNDLQLLHYPPESRAMAWLFWHYLSPEAQQKIAAKIEAVKLLKDSYANKREIDFFIAQLGQQITAFFSDYRVFPAFDAMQSGAYLYNFEPQKITMGKGNAQFLKGFKAHLKSERLDVKFSEHGKRLSENPEALWVLTKDWLQRYIDEKNVDIEAVSLDEACAYLIANGDAQPVVNDHPHVVSIQNLQSLTGKDNAPYILDYYDFSKRLQHFVSITMPEYLAFQQLKTALIEQKRKGMKLEEFTSDILSSFVRNQLINAVYFPLIGANFSKQIGEIGDAKRSDRSGMLLLVSPPGYGKTTLMEYVADRLGLLFVKINGPSLGHSITSVDPEEAKDAGAKNELQKLNLAFEMGDNVMLYLDDIQHCSAEFLQKFISLADGQRRIEGVYNGESKTYDLRGKRFALVMAGNPYTESGEVFKIPDMLANRADVYNLGDMTAANKNQFESSMLENALTANAYLRKLTLPSMDNLFKTVASVTDALQTPPDLQGNFSALEIEEFTKMVRHAVFARSIVMRVNEAYIRSAGMRDAFRNEPPFKLQGSYRNMNKILAMIAPIMNQQEVLDIIINHYRNESQTLTQDAEANLLKLYEIMGILTEDQTARWNEIKAQYVKYKMINGLGSQDQFAQVILQLQQLTDNLAGIEKALKK